MSVFLFVLLVFERHLVFCFACFLVGYCSALVFSFAYAVFYHVLLRASSFFVFCLVT